MKEAQRGAPLFIVGLVVMGRAGLSELFVCFGVRDCCACIVLYVLHSMVREGGVGWVIDVLCHVSFCDTLSENPSWKVSVCMCM